MFLWLANNYVLTLWVKTSLPKKQNKKLPNPALGRRAGPEAIRKQAKGDSHDLLPAGGTYTTSCELRVVTRPLTFSFLTYATLTHRMRLRNNRIKHMSVVSQIQSTGNVNYILSRQKDIGGKKEEEIRSGPWPTKESLTSNSNNFKIKEILGECPPGKLSWWLVSILITGPQWLSHSVSDALKWFPECSLLHSPHKSTCWYLGRIQPWPQQASPLTENTTERNHTCPVLNCLTLPMQHLRGHVRNWGDFHFLFFF